MAKALPRKLVVEAAGDEAADDAGRLALAVKHKARAAIVAEAAVQPLDDVVALAERAQARLDFGVESPAGGTDRLRKPEAFELAHPPDLGLAQWIGNGKRVWAQIDDAVADLGHQRPVELGPAVGVDLRVEASTHLEFGTRTELEGDEVGGPRAQSAADVVAADYEILVRVGATADENVDVRVLGVPVIDRDPVELRAEIALGLDHQLARECLEVRKFGGVVGRDDEAEVVAVAVAAFGEGMGVSRIDLRVEQAAGFAVTRRAVAAEIAEMGRQRARRPHPTHDPRLDHRAA